MAYIITTTTEGHLAPTQPLVWNGEGVVGICRFNEAAEYATPLEAAWALAAIPANKVRFYQLEVAPLKKKQPVAGGHGWMVRHPGYDLMH